MDHHNQRTGVARAKNVRLVSGGLWCDDVPLVDRAADRGRQGRRGAVVEVARQPRSSRWPGARRLCDPSDPPFVRLSPKSYSQEKQLRLTSRDYPPS
ncbi:hypothetical protein CEXT_44431 [Caerostris extrusa]|uniref:Uncharacterized protein n=1 Tax=Caerostris extrusa TaxID=172846 RepID=A0AAV4W1K9_CAEEX|nr:hypothetical protein CEXT_44431 [Caerostris extrusa]